ncbi:MAG TPA: 16S rRNA (guanine(527)-N(7))-methyltransferase RsmG [Spirochaetota bacterium]|nr:16S rRNA (guanine(527)-N(7))-methyltransferase RsmG [Spirochaetota bacterium]
MKLKNIKLLYQGLTRLRINSTKAQKNKLLVFIEELLLWNQKLNLIGTNNEKEIVIKHILDVLTPLSCFRKIPGNIADLGSGGGFPGIPLSIFLPHRITLIESKQKKINFLNHIINTLQLPHTTALCQNINEVKKKFSIITARALADTGKIKKITRKCTLPDTVYMLYKGKKTVINKEITGLEQYRCRIIPLQVPFAAMERNLLKIKK